MGHKHKRGHHHHRRIWDVVSHSSLPDWLQRKGNEYLLHGHRPELSSYMECYRSIFSIHSETGNIWTHLIGCAMFMFITASIIMNPTSTFSREVELLDQIVFVIYGIGAILCLAFSTLYHTFSCHSEKVGTFFQKLDYCGIAVLVMASFVPWLYYSFYCKFWPKVIYMTVCMALGSCCICVSLLNRFADNSYRGIRAAMFVIFGLSGVLPALHYVLTEGVYSAIYVAALHWLLLMAFLYILGAVIYAQRIPERLWPGKFDYWGQSHQIFHCLVIAAAFAHYHGVKIVSANMTSIYQTC